MAASGSSQASGAGAYVRVAYDGAVDHAIVTGLPGVASMQDGKYYDSQGAEVTPTADTELVRIRNARTGAVRYVTLAELAILVA